MTSWLQILTPEETREFRAELLKSYFLYPIGMDDRGFSYVPISRETLEKLKKDPAFTDSQLKALESRVIN